MLECAGFCGNSSAVERNLAKVDVEGSIPFSRSNDNSQGSSIARGLFFSGAVFWAGLVLLSVPLELLADYKASYRAGYAAVLQKNWPVAAQQMAAAAAENSVEGEKLLVSGIREGVYLPYFYLGEARFYMGDCSG